VVIIAVVVGLGRPCVAHDEPLMAVQCEQYVRDICKGKPALPQLGDPDARLYKTAIRRGAASGPNFAGEYTVVGHGCGAWYVVSLW
jgi:hypothetical protein